MEYIVSEAGDANTAPEDIQDAQYDEYACSIEGADITAFDDEPDMAINDIPDDTAPLYQRAKNMRVAIAGLTTAVLGVAYGANVYLHDQEGLPLPESLVSAAGFHCGLNGGFSNPLEANLTCDNRRSGTVAFVLVNGLDGSPPLSPDEAQTVADHTTQSLSVMTDGAVSLQPEIISAPASVAKEVRDNMANGCIDPVGRHTPSGVAVRRIDALKSAQYVIALGGTSCSMDHYEKGSKVESAAAGWAHLEVAARRMDIYTGSGPNPVRSMEIKRLTKIAIHEQLHGLGLGHARAITCDNGFNPMPSNESPIDLAAYLRNIFAHQEDCTFSEYGGQDNVMGPLSVPVRPYNPADAKELLSSVQSDLVSGRQPSSEGARTFLAASDAEVALVARPDAARYDYYGIITPLGTRVTYSIGNEEHTFTQVIFDYPAPQPDLEYVRVYLSNDTTDGQLRLLEMGTIYIPKAGRSFMIDGKTLTFTPISETKDELAVKITTS